MLFFVSPVLPLMILTSCKGRSLSRIRPVWAFNCFHSSNFINYIQSFYYFTKYGIILIKMRSTADRFIYFSLLHRNLSSLQAGISLLNLIPHQ